MTLKNGDGKTDWKKVQILLAVVGLVASWIFYFTSLRTDVHEIENSNTRIVVMEVGVTEIKNKQIGVITDVAILKTEFKNISEKLTEMNSTLKELYRLNLKNGNK